VLVVICLSVYSVSLSCLGCRSVPEALKVILDEIRRVAPYLLLTKSEQKQLLAKSRKQEKAAASAAAAAVEDKEEEIEEEVDEAEEEEDQELPPLNFDDDDDNNSNDDDDVDDNAGEQQAAAAASQEEEEEEAQQQQQQLPTEAELKEEIQAQREMEKQHPDWTAAIAFHHKKKFTVYLSARLFIEPGLLRHDGIKALTSYYPAIDIEKLKLKQLVPQTRTIKSFFDNSLRLEMNVN
jgi:hypothetical protein